MIEARIEPIGRDLDAAFQAWLGPQARAAMLAEAARDILAETDALNAAALGGEVRFKTIVDGAVSERLDSVRADGAIVRVYDVLPALLMEVWQLLWDHSPLKSGRYRESHRLLADGVEIASIEDGWERTKIQPKIPEGTRELVFIPTVSYARLIEPHGNHSGESSQAPDGVYQVVAEMIRPQLGAFGSVSFGYRELAGVDESQPEQQARPFAPRDLRQPVIIIELN